MSRYDNLDSRNELEQKICMDLKAALQKRKFSVIHNGTESSHAPAGFPDIIASNSEVVMTFEVTKSKGAQQDRELNSIRDHLYQIKESHPRKRCYCVFVSPETAPRMLDGIRDHNRQRVSEGREDLKMLPFCFEALELWTTQLDESEADLYPVGGFIKLFECYTEFIDDLRIRKLLLRNVFPADSQLADSIEYEETERDQHTLETLIKDLTLMEDYMRQHGIATGRAAIDTLIYLVFLKLYEEKRERRGNVNRLDTPEAFDFFCRNSVDEPTRNAGRAIHQLFTQIKQEAEFLSSGMFTEGDNLEDTVKDKFIIEYAIPIFRKYKFIGTRIDALGAVYEVLALRAEKDVKVGQFFTPENVVRFMVRLAELDYKDVILDPACGTGRFLIHAMNDMLEKTERSDLRDKNAEKEQVRLHRLFGADIDSRIAKIAKMNMWIHGDGKSNIFGGSDYNGLTLYKHGFNGHDTFDDAFDVILTNPPLGELNYRSISFSEPGTASSVSNQLAHILERMPVIPTKNLTAEQLNAVNERLEIYEGESSELQQLIKDAENTEIIREYLRLSKEGKKSYIKHIEKTEDVKAYKSLLSAAKRRLNTIENNKKFKIDLETKMRSGLAEMTITGNTMKGGAMFIGSIWQYLKKISYPENKTEWRGGKMLIILDEGILNTDDYKQVREFILTHFYIKAIISLTRDTFVPVSKTSTKTSILYAIKKTDIHAVQKEPIFFAHVEHVGLDTKGKACKNDLENVLEKYFDFKEKVLASFVGLEFRKEKFESQKLVGGSL